MPLTPPRPPPQLYPCASTVSLVRSDPPLSYPCDPACFPPKTGFQVSTIAVNLLPGQIISLVGAPPTRIQGLYFMQAVLDEFGSSRRRSSSLPTEAHTRCESSFDRHRLPLFCCRLTSKHSRCVMFLHSIRDHLTHLLPPPSLPPPPLLSPPRPLAP
jgi:hypothetical protein